MDWTPENQRLDELVAKEIVREKRFDTLRRLFPTPVKMTAFSNAVYPYPYRRNSVLALLVQAENMTLMREFFCFYFGGVGANARVEKAFLSGTNQIGQKMNYHYFRNDLPDEVLRQEAFFRGRAFRPKDNEKTVVRQKIYYFLQNEHEKLARREHMDLLFSGREVSLNLAERRLLEAEYLNETAVLLRDRGVFKDIALVNNKSRFSRQAEVSAESPEPFAEQIFKQIDFPDKFFWAGKLLKQFEKQQRQDAYCQSREALFFGTKNGVLVLNETLDDGKINLKEAEKASAYMQYGYQQGPVVGLNNKNLEHQEDLGKVLKHELAHGVDLWHDEADAEAFSDSDFMKLADMALYMQRHPATNYVVKNYESEARRQEVLARIVTGDDNDNTVTKNVKRVFEHYTLLRLKNDKSGMQKFERAVRDNVKNYADWENLCASFESWVSIDDFYDKPQNYAFNTGGAGVEQERGFYRRLYRFLGTDGDLREKTAAKLSQVADCIVNDGKKNEPAFYLWCKNLKDRLY